MKAEEEYHKPSKLIACQSWYVPLKGKVIASGYLKPAIFTILRGRQYNPPGIRNLWPPFCKSLFFPGNACNNRSNDSNGCIASTWAQF